MSIEGAYKDWLILGLIIGIPLILIGSFYTYFVSHDIKFLYFGIIIVVVSLFGAYAKYRFFVDYILALLRHWL